MSTFLWVMSALSVLRLVVALYALAFREMPTVIERDQRHYLSVVAAEIALLIWACILIYSTGGTL
jgi:hypothetical protein